MRTWIQYRKKYIIYAEYYIKTQKENTRFYKEDRENTGQNVSWSSNLLGEKQIWTKKLATQSAKQPNGEGRQRRDPF